MNQPARAKLIARINARRMSAGREPLRIVHIERALRFLFGPVPKRPLKQYDRASRWALTPLGHAACEAYRAGTLRIERSGIPDQKADSNRIDG